jgi:hypothetical protein
MATTDGIITPDYPGTNSNVPTAMLTMAQSLRGRTVRNFASTSTRDTAVSALPTAARQGALVYVQGQGWQGYTKASDPYDGTSASWWSFDRVKGNRKDSSGAEPSNNMHRVDASECFFDGQPPRSFVVTPIPESTLYVDVAFGQFDGGGALIKAIDRRTNTLITGAVAFMWQATR